MNFKSPVGFYSGAEFAYPRSILKRTVALFLVLLTSLPALLAVEYPYIGKVQVNNSLNVRSSAKLDSRILGRLKNNDRVVVLAEEGNFLKLQYPKQLETWVAGWLLLNKGAGKTDTVSRDSVNLRSGPGMQYPQIAQLSQGSEVHILETNKDNWARIGAPSQAVAYVSAKYVTVEGSVAAMKKKEQEKDQARQLFEAAVKRFKAHLTARRMSEQEYEALKKHFNTVASMNPGSTEAIQAKDFQVKLAEFMSAVRLDQLKRQEEVKLRQKEQEIAAEHQRKLEEIKKAKKKEEPVKKFQFEGWLDDIGGILFRPASHRLKKGDRVTYYLKTEGDAVKLDDFVGKHVGVNGEVNRFRGWGKIITVREIEVIHDNPSQFWTPE